MAPPVNMIEGIFRRAAAINAAGTILSHEAMKTAASNLLALTVASIESAMISRLGRAQRMPSWA